MGVRAAGGPPPGVGSAADPGRVWVDGRRSPDGRVGLPVDDPALTAGGTIFETLRLHRGRLLRLPQHLRRFARGVAWLGGPPVEVGAVAAACLAAAADWPEPDGVLRLTRSAGGRQWIWVRPAPPPRAQAACATRPGPPIPWLPGDVKHGARLALARAPADAGVDEVLWTDAGGHLIEGTWSNLWAAVDGELRTPPADGRLLPGVTRAALLGLAAEVGLRAREAPLPAGAAVHELYLSSSVHGLVPVVAVDGRPAPGAGPLGRALGPLLWSEAG